MTDLNIYILFTQSHKTTEAPSCKLELLVTQILLQFSLSVWTQVKHVYGHMMQHQTPETIMYIHNNQQSQRTCSI